MKLATLVLLMLLLASCATSLVERTVDSESELQPPQFVAPPNGVSTNSVFKIVMRRDMPRPCVSLPLFKNRDIRFVVSRNLLEHLAITGESKRPSPMPERSRDLNMKWAQEILKTLSSENDDVGCARPVRDVPPESKYLVARLLDAGQVVVINNETDLIEPTVLVKFFATAGFGGQVSYHLPNDSNGGSFLSFQTWIR